MHSLSSRNFIIIAFIIYYHGQEVTTELSENNLEKTEKWAEKFVNMEDVTEMKRQMSSYGEGYGTDWVVMPDGEGQPQLAVLQKNKAPKFFGFGVQNQESKSSEEEYSISEDVHFMLYTRSNPTEGEPISVASPNSSNYDAAKPTKIIVHGWKSSGDSDTVLKIKDAYLEKSDVNVVGVDWSSIASNYYYPTPASETVNVGRHVGGLIDALVEENNGRHEDFHVIGHSLGAHVAGAAGSSTQRKISRITGLDPALPGFQYYQLPDQRLDEGDAEFVEVIHTCSGALGMSAPAGHADFYPNGGSPFQPGCCCMPEFTEACSHSRAHQYFAESINSDSSFEAVQCPNWDRFKSGTCKDDIAPMGEYTPRNTRGVYYLMTNSTTPFGLGKLGTRYSMDETL